MDFMQFPKNYSQKKSIDKPTMMKTIMTMNKLKFKITSSIFKNNQFLKAKSKETFM